MKKELAHNPFEALGGVLADTIPSDKIKKRYHELIGRQYENIPNRISFRSEIPKVGAFWLYKDAGGLDILLDYKTIQGETRYYRLTVDPDGSFSDSAKPTAVELQHVSNKQIVLEVLEDIDALNLPKSIDFPQGAIKDGDVTNEELNDVLEFPTDFGAPLPPGFWPHGKGSGQENGHEAGLNRVRLSFLSHQPGMLFMMMPGNRGGHRGDQLREYFTFVFPKGVIFENPTEENATYFYKFKNPIEKNDIDTIGTKTTHEKYKILIERGVLNKDEDAYEILNNISKFEMIQQGNRFKPRHASSDPAYAQYEKGYYAELQNFIDDNML